MPNGRGVLVKVLRVGVDGTDKEINAAEYGARPTARLSGHRPRELRPVVEVGPASPSSAPATTSSPRCAVRASSLYDRIGTYDMTTDDTYFERGINLRHGYLTEFYVDDPEYIVKVPDGLKDVGVLLEPLTVVEKGIAQAYDIQRRLQVWRPRRAAVMGAGTVGLLATLVLRLRGLEVTTFGLTPKPYLNSDLIEALGARYETTTEPAGHDCGSAVRSVRHHLRSHRRLGRRLRQHAALGKNGVLVLASVTGGQRMLTVPVTRSTSSSCSATR